MASNQFQTRMNILPPVAVAGDFASQNPRAAVLCGDFAFVAGSSGAVVGAFAWTDTSTDSLVSNSGTGAPRGFIAREQQAMLEQYLQSNSMAIPAGFPVTLYNQGDFWGLTNSPASVGQKVFASLADGSISTAAAGSTIAAATSTASSIAGDVLTIGGTLTGTFVVGQMITGTGIPADTYITALGTGSGGAGTYTINTSLTIASEAINGGVSVETPFHVNSNEPAGALIKMSTWG
jgi:hypothetical protein